MVVVSVSKSETVESSIRNINIYMEVFDKILKSPEHLENLYVDDQLSVKQNL